MVNKGAAEDKTNKYLSVDRLIKNFITGLNKKINKGSSTEKRLSKIITEVFKELSEFLIEVIQVFT